MISFWGLIRDLLGDIFDWDSRVWRTLRPLAFRPGLLTGEFLRGRRAHYTPPFRMYLILSVMFFLIASIWDPARTSNLQLGDGGAALHDQRRCARGEAATDATRRAADAGAAPGAATRRRRPPPHTGDSSRGRRPQAARRRTPRASKLIENLVRRLPEAERANIRAELDEELRRGVAGGAREGAEGHGRPLQRGELPLDIGFSNKYEPRLREACSKIIADTQSSAARCSRTSRK